jgi:Protein of unknown function (DUF4087)
MRSIRVFGCLVIVISIIAAIASSSEDINPTVEAAKPETRCGWFENPTPANAWLVDRDGEWIIGIQGGYQAEGDWPTFSKSRWVRTNNNYGYGCACMRVEVNPAEKEIVTILSSYSKPLSSCRNDKWLKAREPHDGP